MRYTFSDLMQASSGSFVAILIFFAIRGGNPFFFNPTYGIIISILIVWMYHSGFRMQNYQTHFIINAFVSFSICLIFALMFNLITIDKVFTREIFGSLVVIGWWIAFPSSLIFDKFNFISPLKRYYVRGR